MDSEGIPIGNRRELFVDDGLIESLSGAARQELKHPQPAGTVLRFDAPWEGNTSFYPSVIYDGKKYRMYYRGSVGSKYVVTKNLEDGEVFPKDHPPVAAYAESEDGIHWEKPNLGLREFQGNIDNAVLMMDGDFAKDVTHNFTAFMDGNPACPESERYKGVGGLEGELFGFVSDDGLSWKLAQEDPIIRDGKFDSQNVVFWDDLRKLYVAVYRDFVHGVRTIKTATSADFVNWSEGVLADYGGIPDEHLYTNATVPYFRAPHLYVSFPKRFMPFRTRVHDSRNNGLSDGVFMSSRDGVRWTRFPEAFIRPGLNERNWIHRTTAVAQGIYQTGPEELSLYVVRHYTYPSCHMERMTLRLDGFVSIYAPMAGGELITRPLTYEGVEKDEDGEVALFLNYSTSAAGSIRVEIQDMKGNPIPGFALEDSPVLYGDSTEEEFAWVRPDTRTDTNALNSMRGRPIRLRFVLKDADLYAFQFKVLENRKGRVSQVK